MVLLSMGVWIAIGLGVGFLLHWFVPAIDVGMGTLIGVVTLGGCFLWLSRMSTLEALYGSDDVEVRNPRSLTFMQETASQDTWIEVLRVCYEFSGMTGKQSASLLG